MSNWKWIKINIRDWFGYIKLLMQIFLWRRANRFLHRLQWVLGFCHGVLFFFTTPRWLYNSREAEAKWIRWSNYGERGLKNQYIKEGRILGFLFLWMP